MKKRLINVRSKKGMELVQVAILIGIAVAVGLIFRMQITDFVNAVFTTLADGKFTS
jgi:flagellar biosynthetic protein fliQ